MAVKSEAPAGSGQTDVWALPAGEEFLVTEWRPTVITGATVAAR
jgi:hypothetical protein